MKKFLLLVLPVLALVAAFALQESGSAHESAASRSYLCKEPTTVWVGNHQIGPTPEICVPFIQWPP